MLERLRQRIFNPHEAGSSRCSVRANETVRAAKTSFTDLFPGELAQPYCCLRYRAISETVTGTEEVAMKTPLALRIDPEVLAAARACARRDNRTLTNFIETALRHRIAEMTSDPIASGGQARPEQTTRLLRDL